MLSPPACIDLSPPHQILKSPLPMFSTPVGNPGYGWGVGVVTIINQGCPGVYSQSKLLDAMLQLHSYQPCPQDYVLT